jgi:hypothetical protein
MRPEFMQKTRTLISSPMRISAALLAVGFSLRRSPQPRAAAISRSILATAANPLARVPFRSLRPHRCPPLFTINGASSGTANIVARATN